jgi:hypothetical protein
MVIDGFDQSGLVGEMVLHQANGYARGFGDGAQ